MGAVVSPYDTAQYVQRSVSAHELIPAMPVDLAHNGHPRRRRIGSYLMPYHLLRLANAQYREFLSINQKCTRVAGLATATRIESRAI
jgi:hypothetical protein